MLTLLKIRNLALVDELAWELGPGLIGVTGSGAGAVTPKIEAHLRQAEAIKAAM